MELGLTTPLLAQMIKKYNIIKHIFLKLDMRSRGGYDATRGRGREGLSFGNCHHIFFHISREMDNQVYKRSLNIILLVLIIFSFMVHKMVVSRSIFFLF
jgi:hypothetical protein